MLKYPASETILKVVDMSDSPDYRSILAPLLALSRPGSPDGSPSAVEHETDIESLQIQVPPELISSPPPPYLEKEHFPHFQWHSRTGRHFAFRPLRSLSRRLKPRVLSIVAMIAVLIVFGVHLARDSNTPIGRVDNPGNRAKADVYPPQVRGAPTNSFWDNLQDDTKYITAWINAGWTNDFMSYVNLLYLARLTNRTAVLPPFAPAHLHSSAGFFEVGDIFDLPRLSEAVGVPIIQWSDIKKPGSDYIDELGCWSLWVTAAVGNINKEKVPRGSPIVRRLALDLSYTPTPGFTVLLPRPEYQNDPHVRFASLASITFPDGRKRAGLPSSARFPGPKSGHTSLPDDQMACFDFPYYVASETPYEFEKDWSPAWRFVGTHAHWTPRVRNIALNAIRRTLGLEDGEEVPPFISMHVRHGDFGVYCDGNSKDKSECFAPLSAYARQVEEVRRELRGKKGLEVERVLVTSDETDPRWWQKVREMGWEWVDHTQLGTEENLGKWYTVLIDGVVQSLGAGIVGTDKSTMSLIARRRIEDWSGGVGRDVKWGPWVH